MATQAFFSNCEGKRILLGPDKVKVTVKKATSVPDTENVYVIEYKNHPIDGTGYFRTNDEPWEVLNEPAAEKVTEEQDVAEEPLPDIVLQYLHNSLRVEPLRKSHVLEVCKGAAMDQLRGIDPALLDSWSEDDAAVIKSGNGSGRLFCSRRTLFQSTDFCKVKNISTFLDIKESTAAGICSDTAIDQYPQPLVMGEYLMTELRWIYRQFLPPFTKWTTMEELLAAGPRKIVEELKACLKAAEDKNWAVGCGRGRSRSATVLQSLRQMNDIALDIVGAASTGTRLHLIRLQQRAQDKTVALLEELRRELSASLIAGPGKGSPSELYYADRDGRFVMALRCFSVGKTYKDGAVFFLPQDGAGRHLRCRSCEFNKHFRIVNMHYGSQAAQKAKRLKISLQAQKGSGFNLRTLNVGRPIR